MGKLKNVLLTAAFVILTATASLAGGNPSIVFLNPGGSDDPFFGMMSTFMQAAANDLHVDLEIIHCERDPVKMRTEGFRLLERNPLPEYLILINEKNAAVEVLFSATSKGVKVVLINEGLLPDRAGKSSEPDADNPNWLFDFLPDDHQAGYLLAKTLIETARSKGLADEHGRLNMVGISGSFQTNSSSSRVQGLLDAVEEHGDVTLQQVVPGHWEEDKAEMVAEGLLVRYPQTSIIWSASDVMALGALKSIQRAQDERQKNTITGGIDWANFAIHMVAEGEFAATVGGHFMDGGWVLVMLHDYHQGIPLTHRRYMSQFSTVTAGNAREYLQRFGSQNWDSIDFRKFSKKYNPSLNEYSFGLKAVMEQLREQ